MGLIKISFIISFILCLIWIFWIEKHVNRSGKILLVILFGFSAFISFVKHLENLIVIFFMLAIGITYSCIFLVWTYICKNEVKMIKQIRPRDTIRGDINGFNNTKTK